MRYSDVSIANPLPGWHSDKTNLKRARQLVLAGRAVFTSPLIIRFVQAPAVHAAIEKLAEAQVHDRLTNAGYDRENRSFHGEARRLPLIQVDKMLRREKSSRDHSYSAAVLRNRVADVNGGDPGKNPSGPGCR